MVFCYHCPRTLVLRNSVCFTNFKSLCRCHYFIFVFHCTFIIVYSVLSSCSSSLWQCLIIQICLWSQLQVQCLTVGLYILIISHLKCSRYSHEEQQRRCSFVFNIILLSDPGVILTVPNSANGHCKLIFSNIYQT